MPGSLEFLKIFGIEYNVSAESDATFMGGSFENTPISHTGGAAIKAVRRTDSITGIGLTLNEDEHNRLKEANDNREKGDLTIGVNGRTWRATGSIAYDGKTNQDDSGTIALHPTNKNGFVLF